MELRHLRYFIAVAEELHFGRAAARLHIAQPPLSRQIRQLEEELQVTLLTRTKRRVELTDAGRAFLTEARRVFAQAEQAVRAAQRTSRGEIGRLALGFVSSADLDLLPRVLGVWAERFPHVEVELNALTRCQQVEALRDRRIQVGLVRLPIEDAGLVVEAVEREPLVAALPEGHRLARQARVRVADLETEPMIVFPRGSSPSRYDVIASACRQAGFAPRGLPGTNSIQTNLGLIAAGLGVSLVPASARNLHRVGVVYRPLAPPVPHVVMGVAYLRDEASPIVPAFVQVIREVTARSGRERRARQSSPPRRVRASAAASLLRIA